MESQQDCFGGKNSAEKPWDGFASHLCRFVKVLEPNSIFCHILNLPRREIVRCTCLSERTVGVSLGQDVPVTVLVEGMLLGIALKKWDLCKPLVLRYKGCFGRTVFFGSRHFKRKYSRILSSFPNMYCMSDRGYLRVGCQVWSVEFALAFLAWRVASAGANSSPGSTSTSAL